MRPDSEFKVNTPVPRGELYTVKVTHKSTGVSASYSVRGSDKERARESARARAMAKCRVLVGDQ